MEYVTIKRAAELLKISRPTVYKMIADGELKVREFVGRPAIAMSEINKQRNGAGRPPRKGLR